MLERIRGSDVGMRVDGMRCRARGRTNRFFIRRVVDEGRVVYKCFISMLHVYATKNSSHPTKIQTELGVILELTIDEPPFPLQVPSSLFFHPHLYLRQVSMARYPRTHTPGPNLKLERLSLSSSTLVNTQITALLDVSVRCTVSGTQPQSSWCGVGRFDEGGLSL